MCEEPDDYLDRTDRAIERHFAAVVRRQIYARSHPDVTIEHHFRPARYWQAIRTDPDEAMWRIQEKNLEEFVDRLEGGDWKLLLFPPAEAMWNTIREPRW